MSSEFPWQRGAGSREGSPIQTGRAGLPPLKEDDKKKGRRRRRGGADDAASEEGSKPPSRLGSAEGAAAGAAGGEQSSEAGSDAGSRAPRRGRRRERTGDKTPSEAGSVAGSEEGAAGVGAKKKKDDEDGDEEKKAPDQKKEERDDEVQEESDSATPRAKKSAGAARPDDGDVEEEEEVEGSAGTESEEDEEEDAKGAKEKPGSKGAGKSAPKDKKEKKDKKDEKAGAKGKKRMSTVDNFKLPVVSEEDLADENEDVAIKVTGEQQEEHREEMHRGENFLFVETGSDRVFRRKRANLDRTRSRMQRTENEENLKAFLDFVASIIASTFVFCQGILGGISVLTLYYQLRQDDRSFMRTYSPIAADAQRAFLFLSAMALIGALDKYTKDYMVGWYDSGWKQRGLDYILIFMYLVCFFFTLICTPIEDIMQSSHMRSEEWYRWELGDEFAGRYSDWKAFHIIRCLTGIFGWVASSWETRNYLNNAPNKPLHEIYERIFNKALD